MSEWIVKSLRDAAKEMINEDQKGWPNTCADAADEIERLVSDCEMKDSRIDWTVADNVKKAVEIERLQAEIEDLKAWNKDYRQKRTAEIQRALRAERKAERLQARNELLERVYEAACEVHGFAITAFSDYLPGEPGFKSLQQLTKAIAAIQTGDASQDE